MYVARNAASEELLRVSIIFFGIHVHCPPQNTGEAIPCSILHFDMHGLTVIERYPGHSRQSYWLVKQQTD